MREILKNYQNITKQYKDKIRDFESKKEKYEAEIAKYQNKIEKLNQSFYSTTNPDVFLHLIDPLAKKLERYFNKSCLYDFCFQERGIVSIYLVENPAISYKQQPNFRLTVRSYLCEDGNEWLQYAEGKGDDCKWELLPLDFNKIVFLLR